METGLCAFFRRLYSRIKNKKKEKKKKKGTNRIKLNILFSERFCVKFVVEGPKYKYTTIYCVIRGYLEPTKCISKN